VISLGLRLAVSGGREAVIRLVILAAAVGLGVGLLLAAISGINAVNAQNGRHAWLWTGSALEAAGPAKAGTDPLWWTIGGDTFGGQEIDVVQVAATGPTSPVPPGIPSDPRPGEYYAAPALATLLRDTPAGELAGRYPGHLAGVIGDAALPSPDSLVIIIGRTAAQMARTPDTVQVTAIATVLPGSYEGGRNHGGLHLRPPDEGTEASGIDLILSVVALALLVPVLIFIATATRLSAARREQRFAAMRLVGARPRRIAVIAAVESTVAATAGVAAGFGLFFLLRILLAAIPFTGQPFFLGDLSLSLPDILVVAIGVPAAAGVVARLALRRVNISPLGVTRRVTPAPPRAWRVLPLLAGLAELGFFVGHGRPATVPGQIQAFLPGFLLIMIGLVTAGPWLTMNGARIMARRTSRASALIAARRLADDPRAAFRAVSGLILALFITTVAVADITTQNAKDLGPIGGTAAAGVLVDDLAGQPLPPTHGHTTRPALAPSRQLPAALLARLSRIDGVQGVVAVRADSALTALPRPLLGPGVPAGVVSCAQLARVPALGRCPAGAVAAAFPRFLDNAPPGQNLDRITWPAADVSGRQLAVLGVDGIDIATGGSQSAVEQARTVLENANAYPTLGAPYTLGELSTMQNSVNNAYQQLADVVILTSLPIAGCTLAAAIAAGLADRKRPFSLLRLTGARLSTLRRVVALESAVPLLAVAAVAIGIGVSASAMFASVQLQHPLVAPGVAYYLLTAAGIGASLGIIATTFPLLRRITGPETARNE
jgi:hypothetical protein